MPDEAVTDDYIFDNIVIRGSVNRVTDRILELNAQVGDFGTLLYCGKDWVDRELGRKSMELMAEKVMPAVNAALGKSDCRGVKSIHSALAPLAGRAGRDAREGRSHVAKIARGQAVRLIRLPGATGRAHAGGSGRPADHLRRQRLRRAATPSCSRAQD